MNELQLWIVWHCGFPLGIYDQRTAARLSDEIAHIFPDADIAMCRPGVDVAARNSTENRNG